MELLRVDDEYGAALLWLRVSQDELVAMTVSVAIAVSKIEDLPIWQSEVREHGQTAGDALHRFLEGVLERFLVRIHHRSVGDSGLLSVLETRFASYLAWGLARGAHQTDVFVDPASQRFAVANAGGLALVFQRVEGRLDWMATPTPLDENMVHAAQAPWHPITSSEYREWQVLLDRSPIPTTEIIPRSHPPVGSHTEYQGVAGEGRVEPPITFEVGVSDGEVECLEECIEFVLENINASGVQPALQLIGYDLARAKLLLIKIKRELHDASVKAGKVKSSMRPGVRQRPRSR